MTKVIQFATLTARGRSIRLGWKPVARATPVDRWITVHGHINAPDGEWTFRDASLEVGEARRLAAWLADIAGGQHPPQSINFTEPCLAFEYSRPTSGSVLLRARFIGEVSPPWLWGNPEDVWQHGYWLELETPATELGRFAAEMLQLASV